jgi:hypothetical protein
MRAKAGVLLALCIALLPAIAAAQQTGTIVGKVLDTGGLVLPGVTVEARSNVLPTPRVTVSGGAGEFRMPALPPGSYTVEFNLSGMATITRQVEVQLGQDTNVEVKMAVQGVSETVEVTASVTPIIEKDSTALKSGVSSETIQSLPVGQEYRDLIKLIPGVQYTQDSTRGPSSGGSGQDNVYKFDGVNVTLPFYGTLSAEPSSHDIAQVTTIKGGSKAVDFDRAGGFSVDSVSKSGTSSFRGQFSYQFQSDAMAADLVSGSASRYEQDLSWLTASLGGPVIPNKLYFYASYYRPERARDNRSNLYGELPDYESVRNEGFGKLTFTPTSSVLLNVTWRQSHRLDKSDLFGQAASATTGTGTEIWQKIGTADGSWVINSRSFASFKYTYYANPNLGRPDYVSDAVPTTAVGTRIDPTKFDTLGRLTVPTPVAGQDAFNAFVQPVINQYGYDLNGVKTGGGTVGYGSEFNDQDFFRDAFQVGYNLTLGSSMRHDLHAGFQWYKDAEDLERSSNGWGAITVPGGRLPTVGLPGQPAYYVATYLARRSGAVNLIHSEFESFNFEVNDSISWDNLSVNVGFLFSKDNLYGQGLKEDSSTLSGYVAAPGNKYLMYSIPYSKMIQPRIGATWAYDGQNTIYGSWAVYTPAASSLPRAASWDRNILGASVDTFFDANGMLYGSRFVESSSGKLFVDDLTPRTVNEILAGTSRQFNPRLSGRAYFRYREGSHFWEDTNNNARVAFAPPATIGPDDTPVPKELYIPDLSAKLAQIGSGSTYVIAELDGAYTRFYEVTLESEWRTQKTYLRGSYTYSDYWGNFDQDNSTTGNDANIFIGSSNIADGAGRQLWDFKDGTLRGNRPHMLKLYGYYMVPWAASVGAYFIAQSGQPWESWSYEPYIALTTSTSDTNRYAEPAGSRRTPTHYQLDLNYTQNFKFQNRYGVQIGVDLFNVFDKQTGYDYQPSVHSSLFGRPRAYMSPRRIQIAARFQF